MRIKVIGCASTMNEVKGLLTGADINSQFLDYSYHANPRKLHQKLQEIIDCSQEYDLIILTYGRCSNAVLGLFSPEVPILLPSTHDCIGLMLGSNQRHMEMFRNNPATYYFSQGWLDYGRDPYAEYLEYQKKYGPEKAAQLIKTLYGRYRKAVLIVTEGMEKMEYYRQRVREIAQFFGWEVEEVYSDLTLLESLIKGCQGQGNIYVPPGIKITEDLLK